MSVRHFAGDGATVIVTRDFYLAQRAISDTFRLGCIGVLEGPAGLGKTLSADYWRSEHADVSSVRLVFPSQVTSKDVACGLAEALTGVAQEDTLRRLSALLLKLLSEERRLVVIDEAQFLGKQTIEYLRYLSDFETTRFGLLLVGGHGCWQVLSREPMLRSRVRRRVSFKPLAPQEVCVIMRRYHPLLADVSDELLLYIDEHFARGEFRAWASFASTAAELCAEKGLEALNREVADNVFTLHGWTDA